MANLQCLSWASREGLSQDKLESGYRRTGKSAIQTDLQMKRIGFPVLIPIFPYIKAQKSRITKTLNLSACSDSTTDAKQGPTRHTPMAHRIVNISNTVYCLLSTYTVYHLLSTVYSLMSTVTTTHKGTSPLIY